MDVSLSLQTVLRERFITWCKTVYMKVIDQLLIELMLNLNRSINVFSN